VTDWTGLDYVVVDVEGNGGRPPDLVELAAVPIAGGKIGEPTSWLVRPATPITGMARRIHGITGQMVAAAPTFDDIAEEVQAVLGGAVIVAHNAPVDLGVLRRKLAGWEPAEVFDTLRLARRLRPDRVSYRLGSLVEAFGLAEGIPPEQRPHRATYDALVTARLFAVLATHPDGKPLSLDELRGKSSGEADDPAPALF
jgi:DNA polymerase III epsilon subunit-like protein